MRHMAIIPKEELMNAAAVAGNGGTAVSEIVDLRRYLGVGSILAVLDGTTPSISLKISVANNPNDTFRTAYDSNGNDISDIVAAGSEITATRWIQFDPVLAKYMKITATGSAANSADATCSLELVMQEAL